MKEISEMVHDVIEKIDDGMTQGQAVRSVLAYYGRCRNHKNIRLLNEYVNDTFDMADMLAELDSEQALAAAVDAAAARHDDLVVDL